MLTHYDKKKLNKYLSCNSNMKLCSLIFILLSVVSACSNDKYAVASEKAVSVFLNETDAAYEGSLNWASVKPIAILQEGEKALVIRDTYRKYYWACKIKLQNNIIGWSLFT